MLQRIRIFFQRLGRRIWLLALWHSRVLMRAALALVLVLLIIASLWQFWIIPRLEQYRPYLVAELSRSAGVKIEVGTLSGGWDGLRPELTLQNVRALDKSGQEALRFSSLQGALSWWALPLGRLEFSRIELNAPQLHVVRQLDGNWRIAGVALAAQSSGGESGFFNWLLDQGSLTISQGKLLIESETQPGKALEFSRLDLQASQFFGWRRIGFSFTPPPEIGQRVSGDGVLRGSDINRFEDWSGKLLFKFPKVDLARLNAGMGAFLPVASSQWPVVREGVGRLNLNLSFEDKVVIGIEADLGLEKMRLEHAGHMLDLPFFDAKAQWQASKGSEKLLIDARRIDVAGGALARDGRFEYVLDKEERSVLLRSFNLGGLAAYVPLLPGEWPQKLAGASLAGDVVKLHYAWKGEWQQPSSWRGDADIRNLEAGLPQWLPHLGKLDVIASFDDKKGAASLSSRALRLNYPAQFVEVLQLNKVDAAFNWKRSDTGWDVEASQLSLANDEAAVSLKAGYRWTGKGWGDVDLKGDIARLPANRVYAYLPRAIGDDTLAWLKESLRAGRAGNGKAEWRGALDKFPYYDGSGFFKITADVRDVTLGYAKGWPALTGIDAELKFEGLSMTINAPRARVFDVQLKEVVTRIPDLSINQHVLVDGKATGATAGFVRFMRESPVREATQGFLDELKAEGQGQLDLKLDVPIDNTDDSKVLGRYRFAGNKLDFGGSIPPLTQTAGKVDFTESGLKISETSGRMLGGAVKLAGGSENGFVKLGLSGDVQFAEIAQRYGLPQPKRYGGAMTYQGELTARRDRYELALQSTLAGARIDLPQPIGKPAAEARPLRVRASGDGQRQVLEFGYGKLLQGVLAQQVGKPWTGVVGLGAAMPGSVLSPKGVQLVGSWSDIDINAWQALLDGGVGGQAPALSSVDVGFDRLTGWGRRLEAVRVKAAPTAQGWAVQLASKQASGNINWRGGQRPQIIGRLAHLQLPLPEAASVPAGLAVASAPVAAQNDDPKPLLDLAVEDFRYKNSDLGQLTVNATPQGDGWQLNSVTLSNPDGRFSMTGQWLGSGANERTTAKINLKSENTGKLLSRLGYPDALRRAPTTLTGEGGWHGSPFSPDLATVQGKLHLEVEAGQFTKIEPGAGRLLSVISLQSVTRRIKLDFRDVFSEGLEFDVIKGDAVIEKGIAHTDNLIIDSPSAKVSFKGDANIPAGTQNLRIRVVPLIGDAAALAVGVVNPIAGAATFVLQRLMKDPLGQLISYEYDVTGEWADPVVTKVKR